MARQVLLKVEVAILAALQVANFCIWVFALWAKVSQAQVPAPAASTGNADIVMDFMAALPPSDPIPRTYQFRSPLTGQLVIAERPEQDAYFHRRSWVTAHRFLTNKWRGGREMTAILARAATGFASECRGKGGHLLPHESQFYQLTEVEIRPKTSGHTLEICMRDNGQSLGALLIESNKLSFRDRDSHTIVTYHPSIAVTQATLDRQAADRAAADARQDTARRTERTEVESWRLTIRPGTETSCGPVLRVNGDLIELVYFRDRQPKWYRRFELWPTERDVDGRETCR